MARFDDWPRYDVQFSSVKSCNEISVLLILDDLLKFEGKSANFLKLALASSDVGFQSKYQCRTLELFPMYQSLSHPVDCYKTGNGINERLTKVCITAHFNNDYKG